MIEQLPAVNACLNSLAALCLIAGFWAIKTGRRTLHIRCMIGALAASAVFLVSYLVYHYAHGATKYQGEGAVRTVYFAILISHTILAVVNLPLIIVTVARAAKGQFDRHRKIARWTFPIWLYVSVTGVLIYLMLYVW